ncbi:MAG: FAD-binding oxidoreductase [Cyclobacteriaceae bacterium]|nr:FAD-binding oxidoreductase [Cyclobacteriaceae bacterium]
MKQEYDYIIVGQGLAGSCLALQLARRGKSFLVYSDPKGKSASRVAGGLINPVTGRKMVLTWRANELFPYLHKFYREAEKTLNSKFFFEMPIYRPFVSIEEQNEWQGKSTEEHFAPFLKKIFSKEEAENIVEDPFGGLLLDKSGYLDTEAFLEGVQKWLLAGGHLVEQKFALDSINLNEEAVVYRSVKANRIIFCDGVKGSENPYFKEIKYRPVKGEVLKVEIKEQLNKIYNRGVFVMPRNGLNTVGSNYDHNDLSWEPTEKGMEEIESKLKALLKVPYVVKEHKAGVRPSVADRRPVLGPSKLDERLVAFNGLGTKGVSLAPFFSEQLANWLCDGIEPDKEVRIERFFN